jgi:hypothetical protein
VGGESASENSVLPDSAGFPNFGVTTDGHGVPVEASDARPARKPTARNSGHGL